MTMQDARRTLGERIIEAARLAMLAHLECSSAAEHASETEQRQTPAADGVGIATPRDGNVRDVSGFPTDGEPVLPAGFAYATTPGEMPTGGRAR